MGRAQWAAQVRALELWRMWGVSEEGRGLGRGLVSGGCLACPKSQTPKLDLCRPVGHSAVGTEHLLCAYPCPGPWGFSRDQRPPSPVREG